MKEKERKKADVVMRGRGRGEIKTFCIVGHETAVRRVRRRKREGGGWSSEPSEPSRQFQRISHSATSTVYHSKFFDPSVPLGALGKPNESTSPPLQSLP